MFNFILIPTESGEGSKYKTMKKQLLTATEMRQRRVRRKLLRDPKYPRLSVFRSSAHFYAQIIDDKTKKTIVGVNEKELDIKTKMTKSQKASELGKIIAVKAKKKNVEKVVFDRGCFKYHGRVKAFADSARQGGLVF
jgi:large subunit ribosomal protein L18